ncbi:MAG TPA: hypothetical protein VFQ62_20210 [Methylomirabilota bacterium]|nr:hypothetical protein [Methylomirabilota bacterium]
MAGTPRWSLKGEYLSLVSWLYLWRQAIVMSAIGNRMDMRPAPASFRCW